MGQDPLFLLRVQTCGACSRDMLCLREKDKPPRRNFDNHTARGKGYNNQREKGNAAQNQGKRVIDEWHRAEKEGKRNSNHNGAEGTDLGVQGVYHDPQPSIPDIVGPPPNEEEWEPGNRGGRKQGRKTGGPPGSNMSNNNSGGAQPSHSRSSHNKRNGSTPPVKRCPHPGGPQGEGNNRFEGEMMTYISANKYHTLMELETFGEEQLGEEGTSGEAATIHHSHDLVIFEAEAADFPT